MESMSVSVSQGIRSVSSLRSAIKRLTVVASNFAPARMELRARSQLCAKSIGVISLSGLKMP